FGLAHPGASKLTFIAAKAGKGMAGRGAGANRAVLLPRFATEISRAKFLRSKSRPSRRKTRNERPMAAVAAEREPDFL
ncbi:MAG TPA: hypothetical protein VGF13_06740, partial [Verrucomicrobiae bacterium]